MLIPSPVQPHEAAIAQICTANGTVVGVGFAITPRHLLTCAHVVNAALKRSDHKARPTESVTVVFPFLGGARTTATIVYWRPESSPEMPEEDIAGLVLLNPIPNLQPVQVNSFQIGERFTTLGYPSERPENTGVRSDGMIKGLVASSWVEIQGTCEQGRRVQRGFSGTAVWSLSQSAALGMVVAEYKEGNDQTTQIAYMLPYESLQWSIAFLALHHLLLPDDTPNPPDYSKLYQDAFRACRPSPDWMVPDTMNELLRRVQEMPSQLPATTPDLGKLPEFVARLLLAPDWSAEQSDRLRQWGETHEPEFRALRDAVRQRQVTQTAVYEPHLMMIVSSSSTPNHYNTAAFIVPNLEELDLTAYQGVAPVNVVDEAACGEKDLQTRLVQYIQACQEAHDIGERLTIMVFLPMTLLHLPVDRWRGEAYFGNEMIPGSQFTLVIRSYERTTQQYKGLNKTWHDRWQALQQVCDQIACDRLARAKFNEPAAQLIALLRNETAIGFKLGELPQETMERFSKGLLGAAVPVAVWLRAMPQDAADPLVYLDPLLSATCLRELPSHVFTTRAAAVSLSPDEQSFHVGYHLSLLWEDPTIVPPTRSDRT